VNISTLRAGITIVAGSEAEDIAVEGITILSSSGQSNDNDEDEE